MAALWLGGLFCLACRFRPKHPPPSSHRNPWPPVTQPTEGPKPRLWIAVLLFANLAFIGWVVQIWLESRTDSVSAPKTGDTKQDRLVRALSVHLPLAGMENSDPTDTDGCLRLEGFLIDANHHLAKTGATPPKTTAEVKTLVTGEHCTITDPTIAPIIAAYRNQWILTDLPEVGPFVSR